MYLYLIFNSEQLTQNWNTKKYNYELQMKPRTRFESLEKNIWRRERIEKYTLSIRCKKKTTTRERGTEYDEDIGPIINSRRIRIDD